MSSFPYTSYDAVGLAELVRARQVSPNELLDAAFARLNEFNPRLNAVIRTYETRARQEANQTRPGEQPFAGVPLLLKDISQSLENELLTSGSRLFSEHRAVRSSNFVQRLREAGFIIIGHTNTPEFGLKNITEPSLHGPTRNPWNTEHSPGGSSGGAAAAVASGMVPLAGASDGGGSIRIPAAFSGLFGLKPTRGRTPVGPGAGRQWQGASIDFALSRTVRDSAALLDVLQVVQPEAAFHAPLFPGSYQADMNYPHQRKLKIAYTTASPVGTPVSEEAKQAVYKLVRWLEEQGHDVEEKLSPVNGVRLIENYYMMNSGEMAAMVSSIERSIGRELTARDMEIEAWVIAEAGKKVSAAEFVHSLAEWDVAAAQMSKLFERYDFYVTPTNAFPAPRIGELTADAKRIDELMMVSELDKDRQQQLIYEMFEPSLTYTPFTQLANLTGQPAMSVPIHMTPDGLPMGAQIMATKGREDWLFHLAGQLEASELWIGLKGNPMFPA
ncbi:amidase [Paenibacillus sp. JJ-223]|uniref:amidase n=1 Tax=Paenibacillus sp. JJ-223 TaxID=2905647 RepID=UPI001F2517C8|nr:amidase [Paenibacillus sp. JJ-223]CAH1199445.1 6-aminohexanoate-cyclic-dimer hydrolase [Paenibacillus sp. JJ-223]